MDRIKTKLLAALCLLSVTATGCATTKSHKTTAKAAKAAHRSSLNANFSLTDDHNVDERYLRRGREAMHAEALESY